MTALPVRYALRRSADVIAWAVVNCPGGPSLLRKSALTPVAMKSRYFTRSLSAIARRVVSADDLTETNFGIADGLRVLIPSTKHDLVYGRPSDVLGERSTLELAKRLAHRSKAFIDIGANEGIYTFAIAQALGSRQHINLHVFEPDADLFERLIHNLARNGIAAQVHCAAVGGKTGRATFYRNQSDDSSGSLTLHFAEKHKTHAVDVPIISIADYIFGENIEHACLKVDVEGAGVQVWEGARSALDRIDWLIIEIIGPEWEAGLPRQIIVESGWSAYYIRDFDLIRWTKGQYNYLAPCYNWLFCPAQPSQLASQLAGTRFRVLEAE